MVGRLPLEQKTRVRFPSGIPSLGSSEKEHSVINRGVGGSIPSPGSNFSGQDDTLPLPDVLCSTRYVETNNC